MKVGLIQTRTPATIQAALDHTLPLVREAAASGAELIITPECSNAVERNREKLLPQLSALADDPFVRGMQAEARAQGVWILVGSALVRREDGKAANRSALISPDGDITATYDKLHMFDVDLPTGEKARESETYEPGDRAVVAEAAGARLGLTICYDVRFPALHRALALAGAEVLTVPAAFTRPTGEAHWDILLRARAIETGSYVLAAAQGGRHEDGRGTWGRTLAVAPWGELVGKLDHDEPGVLMVDLDLAEVAKARAAIPALANARAFAAP
jgi:predicted amidohydrolase